MYINLPESIHYELDAKRIKTKACPCVFCNCEPNLYVSELSPGIYTAVAGHIDPNESTQHSCACKHTNGRISSPVESSGLNDIIDLCERAVSIWNQQNHVLVGQNNIQDVINGKYPKNNLLPLPKLEPWEQKLAYNVLHLHKTMLVPLHPDKIIDEGLDYTPSFAGLLMASTLSFPNDLTIKDEFCILDICAGTGILGTLALIFALKTRLMNRICIHFIEKDERFLWSLKLTKDLLQQNRDLYYPNVELEVKINIGDALNTDYSKNKYDVVIAAPSEHNSKDILAKCANLIWQPTINQKMTSVGYTGQLVISLPSPFSMSFTGSTWQLSHAGLLTYPVVVDSDVIGCREKVILRLKKLNKPITQKEDSKAQTIMFNRSSLWKTSLENALKILSLPQNTIY